MQILIIDDSLTMQKLNEKALRELGYKDLLICNSAKCSLDILKDNKPSLILLDWHMPEMNGLELLKILKSTDDLKNIPVIMLTIEDDIKNVSSAIENGAEGYLLKPLNKEALKIRLQDIEQNHTLGLKK